jgi:hypothetical protein
MVWISSQLRTYKEHGIGERRLLQVSPLSAKVRRLVFPHSFEEKHEL